MRQLHRGSTWIVVTSGLVLLATGCQGKQDRLIYENFQRVRVLISDRGDVTRSIGHPDHELGDEWLYVRSEDHLVVRVEFDETGRVARTHWIDAKSGTWEDSAESGSDTSTSDDGLP